MSITMNMSRSTIICRRIKMKVGLIPNVNHAGRISLASFRVDLDLVPDLIRSRVISTFQRSEKPKAVSTTSLLIPIGRRFIQAKSDKKCMLPKFHESSSVFNNMFVFFKDHICGRDNAIRSAEEFAKEFSRSAHESFMFTSSCILEGNDEVLEDVLMGDALKCARKYITDAKTEHDNGIDSIYDIDYVTDVKLRRVYFEEESSREGGTLIADVWFMYRNKCQKTSQSMQDKDGSSNNAIKKPRNNLLFAEYQFQRDYRRREPPLEPLEPDSIDFMDPLSDWVISEIKYNTKKRLTLYCYRNIYCYF